MYKLACASYTNTRAWLPIVLLRGVGVLFVDTILGFFWPLWKKGFVDSLGAVAGLPYPANVHCYLQDCCASITQPRLTCSSEYANYQWNGPWNKQLWKSMWFRELLQTSTLACEPVTATMRELVMWSRNAHVLGHPVSYSFPNLHFATYFQLLTTSTMLISTLVHSSLPQSAPLTVPCRPSTVSSLP